MESLSQPRPNWPHRCAMLLACVVFPLIWVGGLVTTYEAGMAVPDWPTTYGYNMFLYPLSTWWTGPWDLFIEHGHRLLASMSGILTILLNLFIWKQDPRRWVRILAGAALALVIFQGVLGGMRVRMNSDDLARWHGCTGPLFFAVTTALCVTLSPWWASMASSTSEFRGTEPIRRQRVIQAWSLSGLAYAQLVLGAFLRHPRFDWSPNTFRTIVVFHLILALTLLLHGLMLLPRVRWMCRFKRLRPVRSMAWSLSLLIVLQIVLGFATWRAKYGWPSFLPIEEGSWLTNYAVRAQSMAQAMTVTSHVAVGSLILALSTCYAMRLSRLEYVVRCASEPGSSQSHRSNPTSHVVRCTARWEGVPVA